MFPKHSLISNQTEILSKLYSLYSFQHRWFVLQKPIKPSLKSIQTFNIHILKQEGLQLNYTTWEKKSPFVCFELASSQFPWCHLAAILEETAKSQSLFLFSWHSSPNRPLPNHDQNLYSLYFPCLWLLSAFTPCSSQQSSHVTLR